MVLFQSLNKQKALREYNHLVNANTLIDNARQRFILEDINERIHGWWPPSIPFFYLWGSVGSGKTTVINIIFENFNGKKIRWHYSDLIHHISTSVLKDIKKPEDWQQYVKANFKKGQLLCIDEWIIEDVTQVMLWRSLLSALWARGVYTVVTSNVSVNQIYENGLGREHFLTTIETIKHHGFVYDLVDTVDYRLKNRTNFKSPFIHARPTFLLEVVAPKLTTECIEEGNGSVVFSSSDLLCVDFKKAITPPMWRKEYIEWVAKYSYVLIQDVIVDLNKNQLANWVRLVDLLYDEGVFVFISTEFHENVLNAENLNWPIRTKSRVLSWINHQNRWAQQNLK